MPKIYHPYAVLCMGNCKFCKDLSLSRKRKLRDRFETRFIISEEL